MQPLVSASREELDIELLVKEGQIPTDIYGHVFVNSSVGSVNSNGLPYPKTTPSGKANSEYGSPILNGDSMVFRFDFDKTGKVTLKSRLLKPPSYYADLASKQGTARHKKYGFSNMGISRISFELGASNLLSTALTPFKTKNEDCIRMLATSDLGRPFEIDINTLKVITPIGTNEQWQAKNVPFIDWVFPIHQTSAHPSFDPITKELFTVNYVKGSKNTASLIRIGEGLIQKRNAIKNHFKHAVLRANEVSKNEIYSYFTKLHSKADYNQSKINQDEEISFVTKTSTWIKNRFKNLTNLKTTTEPILYLMKWEGDEAIHIWKLTQENGTPINILQCMHQTSLSRDYILLIDASFKVGLDVLMNNPFPQNPNFNKILRELVASKQFPYTKMYIVRRQDLTEDTDVVKVKQFHIPIETIHFTTNYENPNGQVTFYTANNAGACLAEWVRYYDKIVNFPKDTPIEEGTAGILAVGEMDIARMGKFVVDVENEKFIKEKLYHNIGNIKQEENTEQPQKVGAHTWGVGLYTHRDIISESAPHSEIKHIYWQCSGIEHRRLTRFVYNSYKNYPNRIVPLKDIENYTLQEIPATLTCLDTEKMEIIDFYEFPRNNEIRALQFIPRKDTKINSAKKTIPSTDGYILCMMINGKGQKPNVDYEREIWIFDAANLQKGAICILHHPSLIYFFTLHSAWIPYLEKRKSDYQVNLRRDYQSQIEKLSSKKKRKELHKFMSEHVFPFFE
ncbi:lignostilbene-alpha,beta-dioxygenase-like enzyme [Bernardetia litoralis DSM 6794]|uniref:Lignostilbene-alpha,beta-dioxygenase-like enzyme n=1 Tax=Bernardetia litoralis (strain ATCC 23117 / DSM 6794 / NBRC 15988 / NCIMB 1366 / Fx l1 / Sio-4) TaxID=880071 RepID=I4AP88_BERLS|nr:carotenoid oxygenase family protein [Bernardetia litoralis]AFM05773.1 lignostilbene-alpha,beta-dioxygenase-like enzyme [Bernardetia litoralis DSM 6794]